MWSSCEHSQKIYLTECCYINQIKIVYLQLFVLETVKIMTNYMKCSIILPCGHACSQAKQSAHWAHKRLKCNERCNKVLCQRKHICEKLCWETCGPCKEPVQADLPCQHEAILPCCVADKYQCQEICMKVRSHVQQNSAIFNNCKFSN
jgi:hypothetical protein